MYWHDPLPVRPDQLTPLAPMLLSCRTLYRYVLCDAYAADRKSGSGGGSYSRCICRAKKVLAPNRHGKFPVPLYIPYFFMIRPVFICPWRDECTYWKPEGWGEWREEQKCCCYSPVMDKFMLWQRIPMYLHNWIFFLTVTILRLESTCRICERKNYKSRKERKVPSYVFILKKMLHTVKETLACDLFALFFYLTVPPGPIF